ncbi:MAG: TRAP transporter small permease [Chloroflexota bacterium]|nr:TRAP transporter small permease [Chloroflexota bacterium]
MKAIASIGRFFERFDFVLYVISGLLIVMLMFLVLFDVLFRTINHPLIGVIEVVGVGLIYLTFLGAAWVLKKGGHVSMDLVLNYASPGAKNVINLIIYAVCAILWLVMTWYSSRTLIDAIQNNFVWPGLLQIPKAYILPAVPIGSFLLFVESIKKTIHYFNAVYGKQPVAGEEKAPQVD